MSNYDDAASESAIEVYLTEQNHQGLAINALF